LTHRALVAVDVNSDGAKETEQEENIFKVNMEAARNSSQLRLLTWRLVVIDLSICGQPART